MDLSDVLALSIAVVLFFGFGFLIRQLFEIIRLFNRGWLKLRRAGTVGWCPGNSRAVVSCWFLCGDRPYRGVSELVLKNDSILVRVRHTLFPLAKLLGTIEFNRSQLSPLEQKSGADLVVLVNHEQLPVGSLILTHVFHDHEIRVFKNWWNETNRLHTQ